MTTNGPTLSWRTGTHVSARILCADLIWRTANSLQPGDEIVAFDEETVRVGNANGGRRYRPGVVTHNEVRGLDSCRVVTTADAITTSAGHRWLVRSSNVSRGPRLSLVASQNLLPGIHRVVTVGHPWEAENTRLAGWMAGVLDADGHAFAGGRHGSWVGFGQVDGAVLDLFLAECARRGWATKVIRRDWTQRKTKPLARNPRDFTDVRINGGMWESCRVLGTLRPERLFPVAARMWQGAVVGKTSGDVEVLRVEQVGERPVSVISTDSRTYVAEGLLGYTASAPHGVAHSRLSRATAAASRAARPF